MKKSIGLALAASLALAFVGSVDVASATPGAAPLAAMAPSVTSAAVTAAPTRMSDFNRDGFTDVIAHDSSDIFAGHGGSLWLFAGRGNGGFFGQRLIGRGWNITTAILTPGDVTGDGTADVLARDGQGRLWVYRGNGTGGLRQRFQVGNGWNGMNAITNAGDMTGDGRGDVLARDTSGKLWLYPITGAAHFQPRRAVGPGWNSMSPILGPGDFSGDGKADILARDAGGSLWLYRGKGTGARARRTLVLRAGPNSAGWLGKTAMVTPGNWDLAGGNDMFTRDNTASGGLWFHPGNDAGGFGPPVQIGHGWRIYSYIG